VGNCLIYCQPSGKKWEKVVKDLEGGSEQVINDFRGEFYHNIDNKGRLSIPRKFAARLIEEDEGRVVVTRGVDRCLWIYPHSKFEETTSKMQQLSLFDPDAQLFLNTFYGTSHDDTLDKTGRILVPKHLLVDYAEIYKEIVIVGAMYLIQVWSLENWRRQIEKSTTNPNEIASKMASHFSNMHSQMKGTNP